MFSEFLCSQCGACCRNVKKIGLPHDEDGVCLKLDKKTNTCTIYENRPEICRVDKMYNKYFKTKMTKKEFNIMNTKICHILIDKEQLDNKYKINIKDYEK
tara:strand:- start:147 stop:446 length:300 start_codon:yes stop_codon:yes gene_type:complete